jgi:hypothetical protein
LPVPSYVLDKATGTGTPQYIMADAEKDKK